KAAQRPPIGSGPGCPYGLDSLTEWSRTIALKRLKNLSFQNQINFTIYKTYCQAWKAPKPARTLRLAERNARFVEITRVFRYAFFIKEKGGHVL
ncbi:MAG: hypothetical protein ACI4GO_07230, partial [Hominenteromicrobium sp.]